MRTIRFTIPYPTGKGQKAKFCRDYGLNAIYSGKFWAKRNRDKDYWHWMVLNCLRQQRIKKEIFFKPVSITFYWDDGLDVDNHAYMGKLIVDALKGYLIENDSKKYVKEVVHRFHEGDIVVEVVEV
ncbi:MAG: hypothetical protein DBY45_01895 [Clostridiales bacterium]|nr:MAG: hypothetical protein DBY45_01895 [Clostridiales bacterium]